MLALTRNIGSGMHSLLVQALILHLARHNYSQCAGQSPSDSLLKADPSIISKPTNDLMKAMKSLAVIATVATGVTCLELVQLHQERDESFSSFASRVRQKHVITQ